jgi:hypothetical protein
LAVLLEAEVVYVYARMMMYVCMYICFVSHSCSAQADWRLESHEHENDEK